MLKGLENLQRVNKNIDGPHLQNLIRPTVLAECSRLVYRFLTRFGKFSLPTTLLAILIRNQYRTTSTWPSIP